MMNQRNVKKLIVKRCMGFLYKIESWYFSPGVFDIYVVYLEALRLAMSFFYLKLVYTAGEILHCR